MENDAFLKKDMLEPLLAKYGKVFKENDILFREGDNSEGKFYILYEGKVKIILDDKGTQTIVNIIEEGEIFGEMALIDKKPRSATAIAIVESKIIPLNEDVFFSLMDNQKNFILNVIKTMINRTTRLSELAVRLSKKDERTRILVALSNIVRLSTDGISNEITLSASEVIKEVSLEVGIEQPRVARYFKDFETPGKLQIDKQNNLIIKNIKSILDLTI